jgi:hypothetical protein
MLTHTQVITVKLTSYTILSFSGPRNVMPVRPELIRTGAPGDRIRRKDRSRNRERKHWPCADTRPQSVGVTIRNTIIRHSVCGVRPIAA